MNDLISRQAAIDALEREKSLVERPITETRWFDFGLRKAQDVLSELPSAQPEHKKMSNREWVDFLSEQFAVSRTSAREMLHGLMRWKAEDNFKKQYSV